MGMVKTVGLVLHPGRNCDSAMLTILKWASDRHVTVLGIEGEADRIPTPVDAVPPGELGKRSDLMVSLGGDGTMLRAMRLSAGPRPPVLGVNVGKLGFLAEIDPPEMADALCAIDEHRFTTEARSAVCAEFQDERHLAFNDVDLARIPGLSSSAVVELTVEGHPFVRYAADALIVATPTGSTAYAFSSGGPVMWPDVRGLLVVPSNAHAMFARPLVVSPDSVVALEVDPDGHPAVLTCDGRRMFPLPAGTRVEVVGGAVPLRLVRLHEGSFTDRLVRKFELPVHGWRNKEAHRSR
jgi:NAD+ kinase